jgi:hypothetical protein
VDRLFASQHVKDLQFIAAIALVAVLLVLCVGLPLSIENQVQNQWSDIAHRRTNWIFIHLVFAAAGSFLTVFAPVIAVFGGVLAWAYQVGSARLGVVDLFACEISTLCRVATVMDTARRYVGTFNQGPPDRPGSTEIPTNRFTSQEGYFPVFETSIRDLQSLEARVVINITAFYTYMKAVRDSLRALAEITPQPNEPPAGPWHNAMRNVIYMLFLGMESARHAIDDLVEFEPQKAERTIVILISEMEAYRFLCGQFTDKNDTHHQRIALRESDYLRDVPILCRSVTNGRVAEEEVLEAEVDSQWLPAYQLLPELGKRYHAAIGLAR